MPFCSSCGAGVAPASRFCSTCGAGLDASLTGLAVLEEATRLAPSSLLATGGVDEVTRVTSAPVPVSSPRTATGGLPAGMSPRAGSRFEPGAIVDHRYRIVGLIGRGGMGEVYRGEDLRLDQPVALKFLPETMAADPARLAQFHNEVRVARQVTHKNVCRIHDIGEVDGRPYLSMEYVDGEDLASLLRRIGRLPQDTAVEMARQLCAGLAAAHERGVLHRDLKPANVMIDGHGHVRLTDFGIAGAADEGEARAGTPGYMAPEQLAGGAVSVQSDLFALGLVLYEMFTGKRGVEAKTLDELMRLHERGLDLSTTSVQPDIDPAIDRVIRRCLARNPGERPTSALAVSAALPGGDPLAAALAAGETPSPEMVAASGSSEAVSVGTTLGLLGAFLACLLSLAVYLERDALIRRMPPGKPPVVLEDRARGMLAALGYASRPRDEASGFSVNGEMLRWIRAERRSADRWAWLPTGRAPGVTFFYRSSPRALLPDATSWRPTLGDPPLVVTGMTAVVLDTQGRLLQLSVVPPQQDAPSTAPPAPANWAPLFAEAGLARERFAEAAPEWTPPQYADARAAWTGTMPDTGVPLRIEAASYRGTPVYFSVVSPWTRPARMEESPTTALRRIVLAISGALVMAIIIVALVMARNNLRSGRGDRTSAGRLAKAVLILRFASWALGAHHAGDTATIVDRTLVALAIALLNAALAWVSYLALEPLVRRHRPASLVAWTRLVSGRWRDPLVARDVLVGLVCGGVFALLPRMVNVASSWAGMPPATPHVGNVGAFGAGISGLASSLAGQVGNVTTTSLVLILLVVVLRVVVRWGPLAFLLTTLVFGLLFGGEMVAGEMPVFEVTFALAVAAFVAGVVWRFGVLSTAAMLFFNQTIYNAPIVASLDAWYAPLTLTALAVLVGLAVAACVLARAGEPVFGRRLLER
jgi:serine/threonine-protein kinase